MVKAVVLSASDMCVFNFEVSGIFQRVFIALDLTQFPVWLFAVVWLKEMRIETLLLITGQLALYYTQLE